MLLYPNRLGPTDLQFAALDDEARRTDGFSIAQLAQAEKLLDPTSERFRDAIFDVLSAPQPCTDVVVILP